jgi:hypothetical protein
MSEELMVARLSSNKKLLWAAEVSTRSFSGRFGYKPLFNFKSELMEIALDHLLEQGRKDREPISPKFKKGIVVRTDALVDCLVVKWMWDLIAGMREFISQFV